MPKILIVDDEPLIRESIKDALSTGEHQLEEAANGQEALAIIETWAPDLVLSDITMEPVNGYELVERIRRIPACLTTRVVLITGNHDGERFRLGMNEGADDYLPKPFYVNDLLKCVAAQLSRQLTYRSAIHNAMRRMTSVLPQELIEPLNGILVTARSMARKAVAQENNEMQKEANSVLNNARKLQHTVENFLLYSQVQAYEQTPGGWNTEGECFYSQELFEATAKSEAATWQREDDLLIDINDAKVSVAADLLQKIVCEVIANACKFSPSGTPVKLKTGRVGSQAEISVENSGAGMTPAQVKAIGAFVQFEPGSSGSQGAGLGLFLAKRLTEIHGGTFAIQSNPEGVTRISIRLPCKT